MKQLSNKEYEEWLKYKNEKAKGHILTPDTIRLICSANDYDPDRIGRHFLEILPRICPPGRLYGAIGNENECVFFWNEDCENGYLSNWYISPFVVDGTTYQTTEQYFMVQKAVLFGDLKTRDQILRETSPKKCKALGRTVSTFDSEVWDAKRYDIMKDGNRAKFLQNPDLLAKLLSTGDALLAEASPFDGIWGIKLPANKALAIEPPLWPGQNLQGKLLMELRAELNTEV